MKRIHILYISIILSGIALFVITFLFFKDIAVSGWCYGIGAALIILGLGFLVNSISEYSQSEQERRRRFSDSTHSIIPPKFRSGYLVCKIMNILLCLYLLLLDAMNVDSVILLLGIVLVVLQFALDLILQIYFSNKKER